MRPSGLDFASWGVGGIPFPILGGFCAARSLVLSVDLLTMATSQVLRHLYSLNTTSPDLLPSLYRLIQNDDKEQYLSGLQGTDLVRLVDFLEEVRCLPYPLSGCRTLHRLLISSRSPMTFTGDAYTDCKPSATSTESCHHRIMFLATSPGSMATRLPTAVSLTYGKALTTAKKSVSNV